MRHKILLPTDFSDNAWSAANYVINLYANKPCTFYFSHAWTFLNLGSRTYIAPSHIEPVKDNSKKQLEDLKVRAESESINRDHKFETIFSIGSLNDTIEYAIKKHKIDLVVMGTKGATGAKEFLLGSNTVAVINKIWICPFLLVPINSEFTTPKYIGFPTDFSRFYGEELLPLKQLADLHESKIKVLHITTKKDLTETQNSNKEMLQTYFEDHSYDINTRPSTRRKEQAILEFIKENDINILTMISYKHSFIQNLIKEPIVKKMGFHSIIPFMVIPCVD